KVAAEVIAEDRNSRLPVALAELPASGSLGLLLGGGGCCIRLPVLFAAHLSGPVPGWPTVLTFAPQNCILRVFFAGHPVAQDPTKPRHRSRSFTWQTLHRPASAPNRRRSVAVTTRASARWSAPTSRK